MILRIGICDDTQTDIIHLEKHIKHYMASYNIDLKSNPSVLGQPFCRHKRSRHFTFYCLISKCLKLMV